MARRVFFSFHYDRDISRANQVRNSNVVAGADTAGFFDQSEYEEAKKTGRAGIERMIQRHLADTSVTIVLIGFETADRPWVKYQIAESVARKNALIGIFIHHLKDERGESDFWPWHMPITPDGAGFPMFYWDSDIDKFRGEIEAAGKRADLLRMG